MVFLPFIMVVHSDPRIAHSPYSRNLSVMRLTRPTSVIRAMNTTRWASSAVGFSPKIHRRGGLGTSSSNEVRSSLACPSIFVVSEGTSPPTLSRWTLLLLQSSPDRVTKEGNGEAVVATYTVSLYSRAFRYRSEMSGFARRRRIASRNPCATCSRPGNESEK